MKKTIYKFLGSIILVLGIHACAYSQFWDGPYVFYLHDTISIRSVVTRDGKPALEREDIVGSTGKVHITIPPFDSTGLGFSLDLESKLENPPFEYDRPSKLFVLSDIEGEFAAFRRLLEGNGVIDKEYNWTYGRGHLVICGDLFDRGKQVVEYLWLLYKLEQDAKAKGGYVHVILGNHDIMNLSGDFRYVQPKYFQTATVLGMEYKNLYGPNTELGRWLRTKNIMEKVGDILFLHAGVAPEINRLGMSVRAINDSTRSFYDIAPDSLPLRQYFLLADDVSPFWYRGYFLTPHATMAQVDSSLSLFGVNQIVVGHTVLKEITPLYDFKVIGIDVNEHEGNSQALLIEDDQYYRVDSKGNRTKL